MIASIIMRPSHECLEKVIVRLPVRLAWRYALSSKSRNLTHLISAISMFVIAAVTAAMIAILSAFNGIESVVTELFGTLDAPIALVPVTGTVLSDEVGDWAMEQWGPDSDSPDHPKSSCARHRRGGRWRHSAPALPLSLPCSHSTPYCFKAAPVERALTLEDLAFLNCTASRASLLGIGVRNMLGIGRDPMKARNTL